MEFHVCKKLLQLDTENTYTAVKYGERTHILQPETVTTFDVADCTHCGCQNILGLRLPQPRKENVLDISTKDEQCKPEEFSNPTMQSMGLLK